MKMLRVNWKLCFKILVTLIFMVLTSTEVALGDSKNYTVQDTPTKLDKGSNDFSDTHVVGSPFVVYIFATNASGKNTDTTVNTEATLTLLLNDITESYTLNIEKGIGMQAIVCPTAGTWRLTVVDKFGNTLKHGCQFSVTSLPTIEVTSVKMRINVGETTQYRAWLVGDNNRTDITDKAVWSSSLTGVATVKTGPAGGLVTGISAGGSDIWLTSGVSNITATAYGVRAPAVLITVVQPILTITPATPTILRGDSLQLKAVYSDAYTPIPVDVTHKLSGICAVWRSGDTSIASVSSAGLVTTTDTSSGETFIAATYLGITVRENIIVVVPKIEITTTKTSINVGETTQFTASLIYSDHRDPITNSADWKSSIPGVATIENGTTGGLVTGVASTQGGSSNITASARGVSATVAINVVQPTLTITPISPTIPRGASLQLKAEFSDAYTPIPIDVTNSNPASLRWVSATPSIASISTTGLVTTTARSLGVTQITATYLGTISGTTNITVGVPTIEITSVTTMIGVGSTTQFYAWLVYPNHSRVDYTNSVVWLSSDKGVADGVLGKVLGKSAGVSSISATASELGINSSVDLTVTGYNIAEVSPGWGPIWRKEVIPIN